MRVRGRFCATAGGVLCAVFLFLTPPAGLAAESQVVFVGVRGNVQVIESYILSAVETKAGEPLNRDTLQKDIEAIYNQGFFSFVDVDLSSKPEGVSVVYSVRENPVVEKISFTGNTV